MAVILYKDGVAHRIDPYRVQQHLAAGYTTTPMPAGGIEDSGSESSHPFPTESKEDLEAWAKENLDIDLDKRKGLQNLIAEVEAAISEQ